MRLNTLGGLALEGSDFNRSKPLLLLSYLAMEGPTSRRELAERFFVGAKDPRDSLSTAVRYLRSEAGDVCATRNGALVAQAPCDAAELLSLLDGGQHMQAIDLYAGPFLKGLDLPLGPELEEWVFATREMLAERVRGACLDAAEVHLQDGQRWEAGRLAERALALPGAPELEAQPMQRLFSLLMAVGSTDAAKLRREAEDLGLVLATEADTSTHDVPFEPSKRVLPTPSTSFVGRRTELAALTELLARPGVRLATLIGPGGVGKSRLARELAAGFVASERFPDGVYFVALDGLNGPGQVPTAIGGALGVDVSGRAKPVQQLQDHLRHKSCLLVLDNYEHLTEAANVPAEIVAGCSEVRVVTTSRQRLGVEEEHLYLVDGLRMPGAGSNLTEAAEVDAVRLFEERARKLRSTFRITTATLPSVQRICARLQGNPLAIELAAAWVRLLPIDEVANELERDLDFLTSASHNVPDRQRSMRTVLEHSWELLTQEEQNTLARLAVFRGGFHRLAAAKVADASLLMLARLVDASMLRADEGARYEAHPLLQHFARERLHGEPAERDEAERRHCAYFVQFLEERVEAARAPDGDRALAAVDEEIHEVLAAVQTARVAGRLRDVVRLMRLAWLDTGYYTSRGADAFVLELLEEAANAAVDVGEIATAHDLFGKLGDACQTGLGEWDRALAAYSRARELARSAANVGREAVFLSLYGVVCHRQGRSDSEAHLDRALELARSADDVSLCAVLEQRGMVFAWQERWAQAREFIEESLAVVDRLEQHELAAPAEIARRRFFGLLNLGEPEHQLGRFQEGLELRSRALAIAEAYGNPIWAAHALSEMGQMLDGADRKGEAEPLLVRALALYERNLVHAYVTTLKPYMEAHGYATTSNAWRPAIQEGRG